VALGSAKELPPPGIKHVQDDQHAEKALGNRDYCLQKFYRAALDKKAPAISTDDWGRQSRVYFRRVLRGQKPEAVN